MVFSQKMHTLGADHYFCNFLFYFAKITIKTAENMAGIFCANIGWKFFSVTQ